MKVSTDSILLGALCEVKQAKNILDIGTGCGILALMLAQKSDAEIVAIDLDSNSIAEAKINFQNSPWNNRMDAINSDLIAFAAKSNTKFDLIISNPPYFSQKIFAPSAQRHQARNTKSLSFEELLTSVDKLLTKEGDFWLILPPAEHKSFAILATSKLFSCVKSIHVSHLIHQPIVLIISHWKHFKPNIIYKTDFLSIHQDENHYSPEFISIIRDFYPDL